VSALVLLLSLVLCIGLLSGCSTQAAVSQPIPSQDDGILLGFSLFDNSQPWAVAYSKSVFDEAEKRGYRYIFADAQNDTAEQLSDVEALLAQGIDMLILTPIEEEISATCLDLARKANVPVIVTARKAKGIVGEDFVTRVGADFIWEGWQAGRWLAKHRDGVAKVVEITGTEGSTTAFERASGFRKMVDQFEGIKIVASQSANFSRVDAQKVMEDIIQRLGRGGFDTVYAHSDEMAIGAIMAMRVAGIDPGTDVTVVSIDGEKEAVQLIKDGNINCIITSTPIYRERLYDTIDEYFAGESISIFVRNPCVIIDINNVDEELSLAF